jgi:hypothetical protein
MLFGFFKAVLLTLSQTRADIEHFVKFADGRIIKSTSFKAVDLRVDAVAMYTAAQAAGQVTII